MELKLEVVLSSSIKRKKPWPRFCWLGQEKESVFLLDDKRISEINLVSGRTKKRTPKLHSLLTRVVTMASSSNGMWLCGLLDSGELFLWNRDKDLLKTAAAVTEVVEIMTSAQGNSTKLSVQVSWDGMCVLLAAITGQVFLWECLSARDLTGLRDGPVKGQWAQIQPLEETIFPSSQNKEASQHTIFVKTEVMGDTCLSAFIFTSGKKLIITCLKIQWKEGYERVRSAGCSIQWATRTYPMSRLTPPCQPVKSRGALVPAFSPDGRLLAVVLNQRKPKATQVLFVSTQNFVSISSSLGGCGSPKMDIPSKYIRSYWVGSVSWSPGGLFLACVLKRGSLLMLARLGGLLTLSSSGCNVDFGPAHFLPLHPLVSYRPPVSAGKGEPSLSSSSLSVRDVLRQRYSVTWHPRLLYLIVSDGYMASVMKVLNRPSPALLLKTLLKDTSKDLEKASRTLDKSQILVKAWLESVSCLNLDSSLEEFNPTVTSGPSNTESVISAATDGSSLPLFLLDQRTLGGTKELLKSVQALFEDDSDLDGPPAGSHVEDGGRLEFASMFDTLHALDTHNDTALVTGPDYEKDFVETERKTPLCRELGKIQSRLLTAWAIGLSLGNAVEHRARLLKHTLCCVVRFAALLHLMPSSVVHTGEKDALVSTRLLFLIKTLLSFLPWDSPPSDGPHCLVLVVEFSKQIVRLLLTPPPDPDQSSHCHLSSQSLSRVMLILQLVSDSLDHTYSLQQRTVWSSANKETASQPAQVWPSDVYHVPLLQDEEEEEEESISVHQAGPVPQRPSSRLFGVWQLVYDITLHYMEELKSFKGCDGWKEEEQRLSVIMSQIQTALQATGEKLEEGHALLSYPGEHLFLCGLYPKSAETWRLHMCQERKNDCNRRVFQEMRHCLALLYSLLSQYHLREAQELGDHMAQLILHRAEHHKDNMTCTTAGSPTGPELLTDLHSDAACAVIQTLGRFMASYFTNQPLYILPPHNVAVLPPLHLPHASSVGRVVPLCQEEVARAVRQQHLSEVWTVDYCQDLLLLGGLLPETVWLAYHLGDWKTAVSLSLAYTSYTEHSHVTRLRRRELHLPTVLEPQSIFQAELECLLGSNSQECTDKDGDKSFTEPLEGEDWDLLQVSIQDVLKASVMAGVNVMSSPLSSLLDTAKELCSSLPTLVPAGLYLPSPPLYCPQPSPNTQDQIGTTGQFAEVACRHKVSGVLQRLLLLLRSGRCCHPAAQWYISHLRRARHLLHKIKKKYSYASAAEEEKAFPEGLMKFITRGGFFRQGPNKDGRLDPDTIQTIVCFRELCALCWMLHVRDQLSIYCRRYQTARQQGGNEQISGDQDVTSACVDALRWARRFLPFSCFLNAEEILQDVLLSLVSELPAVSLVADTLVRAFPEEEESVRVPLREKYNSLLQRLRQCNVIEGEKDEVDESMMILIQDKFRQRRKHLARLQRHLAPTVLHLWEKEEEEEDRGSKHGMAMLRKLSLGTSLSTSTLTDAGFPPVCSDGDTAENTSEAISLEQRCRAVTRGKIMKKVKQREHAKKTAIKIENVIQEEGRPGDAKEEQPSPPVVGTWEFELEDDEYLHFLELFLSYVLEKDSPDVADSSTELPLLKGFSCQLRERELHSLTFDVLTTIHRRQKDGHHPSRKYSGNDPPVFRAGCCYKPGKEGTTPELQASFLWSEAPISRTSLSVSSHPEPRAGRQKGLFGLRQQSRVKGAPFGSETSPLQGAFTPRQPSHSFISGSSMSVEAVAELQQGLDPKLEAQFPELGRLLEWMVRWADRRVLLGHHGKKKKDKGGKAERTADDGVVIRVKASAPAVLTSLSLLQSRYTALLATDRYSAHIPASEMQWTVAPVLQPEVERESSIDTGYPGSANTPITGLHHNLQQEELSISRTDEPEELTFHRTPLLTDEHQPISGAQQRQSSSQQLSLADLDVTPEKEGKRSDSEGLEESSSCSSGNICTPETSLKLADLDCSEEAGDMFSFRSQPSDAGGLHAPSQPDPPAPPHPPAPPPAQPEASIHTEPSDSTGVLLPNTAADPPALQPRSSTADSTASNQQPPTQTPPIRQRLGEDLFRLVQHINYMSLSEVLGASFSNLQLVQQSSTAQPDMNSSHPPVPSSFITNPIPEPNALPVQTTISVAPQIQAFVSNPGSNNPQFSRTAACTSADQPAVQSSARSCAAAEQHHTNRGRPSNASGAGVNYQEMQPLSVQAESPDIQLRQSRGLIPSSQGLLATTDTSHAIHSNPVSLPSNGTLPNDSAPQLLGLKLLQLRRPRLLQQSAAHHPSAQRPQTLLTTNPDIYQHKFKHSDHVTSERAGGENIYFSSVPKRQLSFNPPHDSSLRNSQPHIWASEQSRGQEFPLLSPVLPAHTPMQGLRLVHIQPAPHGNITFPRLPVSFSSVPAAVIAAPVRESPVIKLLHIESGPRMMMSSAAPLTQTTRLISVEELQLLRANQTTERATSKSSKRQKRRERAEKAGKIEVTFRPNDSIIPTQEPAEVAEEILAGQDVTVPHGSFDTELTGQRLLIKAMSTSAELHAFASTCKRPPERHDAFTNTDPARPPTSVGEAESVRGSVMQKSPNSQSSLHVQMSSEDRVQESDETPQEPETILDLGGRQFISVLDLEDVMQHQDASSIRPSSPTSAQLHLLATSVIRNGAAAATTHPDIPEESPSFSHVEASTVSERIPPPDRDVVDPSASEICGAIKTQSVSAHRASSSPSIVWFSSRLSELDVQLAALQNIADHLEMDFSNSRMLVNTNEKLNRDKAPDVNAPATTAVKKTVRLSLPHQAQTPRRDPDLLPEPSACEVEDESREEEYVVHSDSYSSGRKPSFHGSTWLHSQGAGPFHRHTPPRMRDQFAEEYEIPHVWTDENLGHTKLSDTAEMLDELVREGYLSPTDLDLSTSQTAHHSSRPEQPQMSQRRVPEDERRELRTWMRRKQRDRLAVYHKHRASLRERERKPFSSSAALQSRNRNGESIWRTREEKEKLMLLEQFNQRTRDACSLASDFLTSPGGLRSCSQAEGAAGTSTPHSTTRSTTRSTSAPLLRSTRSVSANDKRSLKPRSGQAPPLPRPRSAEVQGSSEGHRRRLGLHRPVTFLPRDRLSQVTRRGMLTDTKRPSEPHTASQREERHVGHQRKTGTNTRFSGGTAAGRGNPREPTREEETEEMEPSRLQSRERSNTDDGVSGLDWLDELSGSDGSSLSEIDWAAIERMVAAEHPSASVSQGKRKQSQQAEN
ncbi:ciliogenesis and planar polarity effector 1 isoform X2 [Brachyistius frenatus]|uniref:ciliogenesis and planar polarity effector 1 isoform X2 n=1 Tax=Brachyistius frenatus TaxID=100188 RepID=UPI0037E9088E